MGLHIALEFTSRRPAKRDHVSDCGDDPTEGFSRCNNARAGVPRQVFAPLEELEGHIDECDIGTKEVDAVERRLQAGAAVDRCQNFRVPVGY